MRPDWHSRCNLTNNADRYARVDSWLNRASGGPSANETPIALRSEVMASPGQQGGSQQGSSQQNKGQNPTGQHNSPGASSTSPGRDIGRQAQETAASVVEKTKETASGVGERIRDAASSVQDKARKGGEAGHN